ncbi:MAG: putative lipopolysaccharide heptosyltransferase III [Verrucomicrobiota bacterium]|nr:putative lipopolysaccharide heptosyltransferase III [Verrucomicrobiota bacterium]
MNILLIQLKRIGDLVLTTPAIAAIRERYPRARISLIVSSDTRELLPAICGVDQTFIARKKITDAASWFTVARRRYDYCFDFTRNDRSAFLTLLSGAKKRVTADHPRLRAQLRSRSYNVLAPCDVGALHTVDYHLCLLGVLGIENASTALQLELPQSAIERADEALRARGITGEFVLLHPGSARSEKFWEAKRWAEVIRFLNDRDITPAISGGPSRAEQAHIAEIRAATRGNFIDLSGAVDLLGLAASIARARLLVTVDSAPMHFAAAMQTPQVVLFGPTNPMHWYPRGSPAVILQGHQREPLTAFDQNQSAVPMNRISTQQVINGMEALLATQRAATS